MYIPLDYYRILGLPIQATAEQLRQAHRDRTLQLPRREYSDAAISLRRQLLDEAYAVLSDPEQRRAYDATFLARTYELVPELQSEAGDAALSQATTAEQNGDSHTPSIEIQDDQLVGALLILQELGEYELVLKLGRPFLTGGKANLKTGLFGDPDIVYADIVLTVALACLELGREQWQQGQYENAAEALETGQQLLLREGLFVGLRGEIQTDLFKLRPYRVLELLALPEHQTTARHQGLQLLQEMLKERGGIDGAGNDQSGLNIDDFLRFIQQLRSYLTAAEQQVLFEEEARRPSAVATYLAVYALMAKGFADRQPGLIQRAKQMLLRLSARQDVHLEQAVCTLLLGQTEDASQALEHSQEYEALAFIREHSQGAPDLLPGLCLYAEHWLQGEVFPHFRDLSNKRVSLKDYFADRQVQEYLEALPNESEIADDWSIAQPKATHSTVPFPGTRSTTFESDVRNDEAPSTLAANNPRAVEEQWPNLSSEDSTADSLIEVARSRIAARTAASVAANGTASGIATMPTAERVTPSSELRSNSSRAERTRRSDRSRSDGSGRAEEVEALRSDPTNNGGTLLRGRGGRSKAGGERRWLPIALIAGVAALGFVGGPWLWKVLQSSSKQSSQVEQPLVQLDRPLISLPQPSPVADPNAPILNNPSAEKILESWFAAKAAAMGPEHDVSQLEGILLDPKLSEWIGVAEDAKANNSYRKFKHEIKVSAVEQTKEKPDLAKVTANVNEITEYYEGTTLKDSVTDQLQVQYDLVRKDAKWKIENWSVL